MLIGELASRANVNIETIRYYERIGLMPPPPRRNGRHRTYDETHLKQLKFVRRGRELGFSLDDVRTLLALANRGDEACAETRAMTLRHLTGVRARLSSLRALERALSGLTKACRPGQQDSCPILDALSDGL